MKLAALLSTATVCHGAFDKKSPKQDILGRLGKNVLSKNSAEEENCGPDFSPVIELYSAISNNLGPQVMSNLFLEDAENMRRNLISSPFTLANQLTLLFEATSGETREQIKKLTFMSDDGHLEALRELKSQYDCLTKGKIQTKTALFLDDSFRPKADIYRRFKAIDANMYKVDFAGSPEIARILIDSWVGDFSDTAATMKLPENSVRSSTSLMLLSSAHFEAKWSVEFDYMPFPAPFKLLDGSNKLVEMMEATYPIPHILSCTDNPGVAGCNPNEAIPTMVEIPLNSTRLQVVALKPNRVLPKEALVALSPDYFHRLWLPAADNNLRTVRLRLPKIDIESQYEMSNALFGMGIEDAFLPFRANFTSLTDDIGISLSNIYQQSYLKWDKEGAAGGVTNRMTIKLPFGARGGVLEQSNHDIAITFDESFVVFITDRKTKTNLFIGVVNDPNDRQ